MDNFRVQFPIPWGETKTKGTRYYRVSRVDTPLFVVG